LSFDEGYLFSVSQIDEATIVNIEEVGVLDVEEGMLKNLIVSPCRSLCGTDFGDPALLSTLCTPSRKVDQARQRSSQHDKSSENRNGENGMAYEISLLFGSSPEFL
jgi:hypothetical protein